MSTANFQIAYEGEAVRSGSMDVHELAPALLAIGDLVEAANETLNGDKASVSVSVQSDFKRSSFEIGLLVDQGLIDQAKAALFGHPLIDAEGLLKFIFGGASAAVITGVIKIYKALRGEPPKSTGTTTINEVVFMNTGSGQILNNVDASSATLYTNDVVRDAVRRVIQPLEKPGIDKVEVRRAGKVLESVSKDDAPFFLNPADETGKQVKELSNTREVYLRIDKPAFVSGQSWRFSDGDASFGAKVNDKSFEERIQKREEGFFSGDRLHVRLREVQSIESSGEIKTERFIDRVIEHLPAPKQSQLFPASPKSEDGS